MLNLKWSDLFGTKPVTQEFTAETLSAMFDEVDQDPRAGLGNLTKRQIVIDKIISQHRIVLAQARGITPRMPKPVVGEAPAVAVLVEQPTTQAKAANLTKAAGM